MAAALVEVQFYGDALQATQDDSGTVLVGLRSMCEGIGVDIVGQTQRLQRLTEEGATWARTTTCVTQAVDGRQREVLTLPLDSVPMWLTGIAASRVKPEIRTKLVRYQNEAAKVLAEAFLRPGSSALAPLDQHTIAIVKVAMQEVAAPIVQTQRQIGDAIVLLGQGFDEHQGELRNLKGEVSAIRGEVTTLKDAVERSARHKRKEIGARTRSKHLDFVRSGTAGADHCFWCKEAPLLDLDKQFIGEMHHHDAASDAGIDATMPVCRSCNSRCNSEPMPRFIVDAYHYARRHWEGRGPLFVWGGRNGSGTK